MIDLLTPERTTGSRPDDPESAKYVRSFLFMRLAVGALGVALPVVLMLVDGFWFDGDPFPRDSLSAYFYSGGREVFVGTLCAIGVFLVTYKAAERTLDNTLSLIAGAGAAVVALFPTDRPLSDIRLTPLQDRVGEEVVKWVHFGGAAVFIGALGVITYYFGVREGARPPREGNRSPAFWRWFHWACAGAIGLAVLWIAVTQLAGRPRTSLLIGETAAVWAFGVSWFAKGAEWDVLFGRRDG